MLSLNDPDWRELEHAYGQAGNVPDLLRQLEHSPEPQGSYRDEPWFSLWSSLCHQGDVYSASYAAVPHVVRICLGTAGPVDQSFFQFPACVEVARSNGRVACFPELVPGVRRESGYFRNLIRRCGDGTEGQVDGGDHRILA